jgi:hypothetical protein
MYYKYTGGNEIISMVFFNHFIFICQKADLLEFGRVIKGPGR